MPNRSLLFAGFLALTLSLGAQQTGSPPAPTGGTRGTGNQNTSPPASLTTTQPQTSPNSPPGTVFGRGSEPMTAPYRQSRFESNATAAGPPQSKHTRIAKAASVSNWEVTSSPRRSTPACKPLLSQATRPVRPGGREATRRGFSTARGRRRKIFGAASFERPYLGAAPTPFRSISESLGSGLTWA